MNILILTHSNRSTAVGSLFQPLVDELGAHILDIAQEEQKKLVKKLKKLNLQSFERVILDIRFKRLWEARKYTQQFSNLVFIEEDACQDLIVGSKWFGKFSEYYRMHGDCKVLNTGFRTSSALACLGVDSYFFPKVCDTQVLYNEHIERDVDCLFIGRYSSQVYASRKNYIEALQKSVNLQIGRADYPHDYRSLLNKAKIFFSADVGLNEYMGKNFEAMGCGCAVVAYAQGWHEEEALGLQDMKNIVLYRSIPEAIEKITLLLADESLLKAVAQGGESLVSSKLNCQEKSSFLLGFMQEMNLKPA